MQKFILAIILLTLINLGIATKICFNESLVDVSDDYYKLSTSLKPSIDEQSTLSKQSDDEVRQEVLSLLLREDKSRPDFYEKRKEIEAWIDHHVQEVNRANEEGRSLPEWFQKMRNDFRQDFKDLVIVANDVGIRGRIWKVDVALKRLCALLGAYGCLAAKATFIQTKCYPIGVTLLIIYTFLFAANFCKLYNDIQIARRRIPVFRDRVIPELHLGRFE